MAKIQLTATHTQVAKLKSLAADARISISALLLSSIAVTLQDKSLLPAADSRPNRGVRKPKTAKVGEKSREKANYVQLAQHSALRAQANESRQRTALVRKALRDAETANILQKLTK